MYIFVEVIFTAHSIVFTILLYSLVAAMGLTISSLFAGLFGKANIRLLMVGLDGAGKTTVLYKLKMGEVITTVPTIGKTTPTPPVYLLTINLVF